VGVAGAGQLTDMLAAEGKLEPYWFDIRASLRASKDLGEVSGLPDCKELCKRLREHAGPVFCQSSGYIRRGAHIRPVGSSELPSKEVVAKVRSDHGGYPAGYVIPEGY